MSVSKIYGWTGSLMMLQEIVKQYNKYEGDEMETTDLIEQGKELFTIMVKEKGRMHEDVRIYSAILTRLINKHELAERRLEIIQEYKSLFNSLMERLQDGCAIK